MSPGSYKVYESVDVFDDYVAITTHIEHWTGDRATADRTVDAIRGFVKSLSRFPHRGTCREDLLPGLRVVPFGKRTAIAFTVVRPMGKSIFCAYFTVARTTRL